MGSRGVLWGPVKWLLWGGGWLELSLMSPRPQPYQNQA